MSRLPAEPPYAKDGLKSSPSTPPENCVDTKSVANVSEEWPVASCSDAQSAALIGRRSFGGSSWFGIEGARDLSEVKLTKALHRTKKYADLGVGDRLGRSTGEN